MKKIAIEMSIDLRRAFKTACAINGRSMKDVLVEGVRRIIDDDELCYDTCRPARGEGMCTLCMNIDDELLEDVRERKQTSDDKIRDVYITSIINYLEEVGSDYDYSDDIK